MEPVTTVEPAATPDATVDDAGTAGRSPRLIGAIAGAVAGLLAIAALFVVGRLTGLSEWSAFALVVGEDGVFSPTTGAPLAWVVPPLAAAMAGGITGPTAARHVAWAGTWMGFVTYAIGVVVGAVVLVVPMLGGGTGFSAPEPGSMSVVTIVVGVVTLIFIGTIVFAPVLLLCVAAGAGWAAVVRRVVGAPVPTDPGSRPILALAAIGGVLALLWLALTTFLDILVQSQTG